jgi:virulence-associated protein VagC
VTTAKLIDIQGMQGIQLPPEFSFEGSMVTIRKVGDAVILEPTKPQSWPEGFFAEIRIADPAFTRPDQGQAPAAPVF